MGFQMSSIGQNRLTNFFFSKPEPVKSEFKIILKIDVDFIALVQVAYKDSNNNNRISRFYAKRWEKEMSFSRDLLGPCTMRVFINSSAALKSGVVNLTIVFNEDIVAKKSFWIQKEDQPAGWLEISYNK